MVGGVIPSAARGSSQAKAPLPELLGGASDALLSCVVLPCLLLQAWLGGLPSKKNKKARKPPMLQLRAELAALLAATVGCAEALLVVAAQARPLVLCARAPPRVVATKDSESLRHPLCY